MNKETELALKGVVHAVLAIGKLVVAIFTFFGFFLLALGAGGSTADDADESQSDEFLRDLDRQNHWN